jgi:hypothetical protein
MGINTIGGHWRGLCNNPGGTSAYRAVPGEGSCGCPGTFPGPFRRIPGRDVPAFTCSQTKECAGVSAFPAYAGTDPVRAGPAGAPPAPAGVPPRQAGGAGRPHHNEKTAGQGVRQARPVSHIPIGGRKRSARAGRALRQRALTEGRGHSGRRSGSGKGERKAASGRGVAGREPWGLASAGRFVVSREGNPRRLMSGVRWVSSNRVGEDSGAR